jgi:hypothetical protein
MYSYKETLCTNKKNTLLLCATMCVNYVHIVLNKEESKAKHQWLIPIILITGEAKTRRITV